MIRRRLSIAVLSVTAWACATPAPAPHPRALENNEYCAQYLQTGNLDRAETYCDLGLQFAPNYADLWVNKGLIALKRNQTEAAKKDFYTALHLNPDQAQACTDLGFIYLNEHEYGKAHDKFQHALKVNPDYIEARYDLALTFKDMGDRANARREYHTLLAVKPDIADAHNDLGAMALEDHAYEEAITELNAAVKLDQKFADAWANLGTAYLESGKFVEAKDAFAQCLAADAESIPCRTNATIANRKAALLDPTLKDVQADEGVDGTAPSLYQRSMQFRDKGLKNEEERFLRRCVKADGKYAPCYFGLHLLYKEDHKDRESTIACKNFLKFAVADEFPKEVTTCEKYVRSAN